MTCTAACAGSAGPSQPDDNSDDGGGGSIIKNTVKKGSWVRPTVGRRFETQHTVTGFQWNTLTAVTTNSAKSGVR